MSGDSDNGFGGQGPPPEVEEGPRANAGPQQADKQANQQFETVSDAGKPRAVVADRFYAAPNFDNIPAELRAIPRWVVWGPRLAAGAKPSKAPRDAKVLNGPAAWNDPSSWATFDQARAACEELDEDGQATFAGVGIMLDGTGRLVGVDIDHCVDAASNTPDPKAMKLLNELGAQYIEVSPSGTGLRAFGYSEPLEKGVAGTYEGLQVELYSAGRYLTVTGDVIKAEPLGELDSFVGLASHIRSNSTGAAVDRNRPGQGAGASQSSAYVATIMGGGPGVHAALLGLAASLVASGMNGGASVSHLRGLMNNARANYADAERWTERYNSIPKLVSSAEAKFAPSDQTKTAEAARMADAAIDCAMLAAQTGGRRTTPSAFGATGQGVGAPSAVAAAVGAPDAEDDGLSGLSLAPVFDYGMCPGVLGDVIKSETEFSEAPEIGVLASIVTRLSADVGRTAFFSMGHDKRHIRINWIGAGPSGLGRKGTAAGIADAVRAAAFAQPKDTRPGPVGRHTLPPEAEAMLPARTMNAVNTGEGLINMLRTTKTAYDKDGFTPPGAVDNRLMIDAQEFAGVLKKASGKEATLSPVLRDAADGKNLSNTSMTNPMTAENPHVVIGASVPDTELVKLLSGDSAVEASNGLLNRFVITYQVRKKVVRKQAKGQPWRMVQMADAYRQALATAWGHDGRYSVSAESTVELTRSDEAEEAYGDWYVAEQGRVESTYIKTLMVRAPTVVLSYAAMLALLRGSRRTDLGDVVAAIALVDYWRSSLEFIFTRGQETAAVLQMAADTAKLIAHLAIGKPVPMNALKDVFTAKKRKPLLDWAQRQSPPLLSIKRVQGAGGGRPAEIVTRLV